MGKMPELLVRMAAEATHTANTTGAKNGWALSAISVRMRHKASMAPHRTLEMKPQLMPWNHKVVGKIVLVTIQ